MSHRRKEKDLKKKDAKRVLEDLMKKKECIFDRDTECIGDYNCNTCSKLPREEFKKHMNKVRAKKKGRQVLKQKRKEISESG